VQSFAVPYLMLVCVQGYLTDNGIINLSRVEKIMRGIGKLEDEIFRRRRQNDLNYRAREVLLCDDYDDYVHYCKDEICGNSKLLTQDAAN